MVVANTHTFFKYKWASIIYRGGAVMTVIHLLNRLPTKAIDDKTHMSLPRSQATSQPPACVLLFGVCQEAQPCQLA
jgi:hypothetical protein